MNRALLMAVAACVAAVIIYLIKLMPSNPAAIGSSYTPGTPGSPAAPGSSYTPGTPGAPAAPGSDYLLPGVRIAGTLDPDKTGFVPLGGISSGRPWFASDGSFVVPPETAHLRVAYSVGRWRMNWYPTGGTGPRVGWVANAGTEADPSLAAGWAPDVSSDIEPTGVPSFVYIPARTAPGSVGSDYAPGTPAAPSAPGSSYTPGTPAAPSAPGSSYTPGTPAAPPAASADYSPGTPSAPAAPGGDYNPGTPAAPSAPGSSYSPATPANPPAVGSDYSPS